MPTAPKRPCRHPGCAALVLGGYCDQHRKVVRANADRRKPGERRPYDRTAWRKLREQVLRDEPVCRECKTHGVIVPATCVDHRDGNAENNDRSNLQPLCQPCHSRKTALHDGGFGRAKGVGGVAFK